ncbi:PucR C-terminal helix-turn-helix domain-containing protein [Jatrophihabitans endophyticus]|uniref:PucR C-terminal helix-turn-helix domain-containing protein n=1 Tax=Jatrophihabitans endophyticus TaxID=1206085 RepID=A0A1M5PYE7_9ACTN|nr:GAF domain-containing protein [Jatrophihabitans endophyticus]SHH06885.1 PucR C-terminal helix-turn-helix domain-containing protein [Jatrophihabitans endophyticus]
MALAQLLGTSTGDSWNGRYAQVLEAFEEVSLLSTSGTVELDDVLRLVGRRLCELLSSNRCSVYLRQSDGTFRGQLGYCTDRDIDGAVRKLVAGVASDQFTAEVVSTAKPVIVSEAVSDPRTIQRTMRRWGVRSMLGVPLVVDTDVIGVIYVDNERARRDYTDQDTQVAQAFAALAAIVVRQSWMQARLRDNANVIDRQRTVLSESSLIHTRVTKAVLEGSEVSELIALTASLLRRHVVLYTPEFEVDAWAAPDGTVTGSCPAMTRDQARSAPVLEALQGLSDGEPSFMIQPTRELRLRRLLAALVVDHHCVGYLELCESGTPFTLVDRRAIEQAAMALALRMLARHRSEALDRQERELYFSDLLYGRRDTTDLIARAGDFGVDAAQWHTVLLLQYQRRASSARPHVGTDRTALVDLVGAALPAGSKVVASTGIPGAELVLVETAPGDQQVDAVDGLLTESVAAVLDGLAERFDAHFCVVSDICRELADVAASARRSRQLAGSLGKSVVRPRVVPARSFDLVRLIGQRTGIVGAVEYAEDVLAPIAEYDRSHGTELERTLCTFVKCDAQLRRTAVQLGVHDNTVRYRLGKVREIAGIKAERLESLAQVLLATQIRDLVETSGAGAG